MAFEINETEIANPSAKAIQKNLNFCFFFKAHSVPRKTWQINAHLHLKLVRCIGWARTRKIDAFSTSVSRLRTHSFFYSVCKEMVRGLKEEDHKRGHWTRWLHTFIWIGCCLVPLKKEIRNGTRVKGTYLVKSCSSPSRFFSHILRCSE